MATHRSLNKLEFKAHMSIHNTKEVPEGETHEAKNGTRDRFGKNHALSNEDGTARVPNKRCLKAFVFVALLGPILCLPGRQADASARNTDIQVSSDGLDANSWINQKLNQPEDKFGIPIDGNTSIGINDDGDPNVGMKF